MTKILFLDCDSTLSTIEGIDELAAGKDPSVQAQVVELTNDAMSGKVPIDDVFARRLELIRPSMQMCQEIGRKYVETVTVGVREALVSLRQQGWKPVIVSGGFDQAIEPLAAELEIEEVYAVALKFNPDGSYQDFDRDAPTSRNHGKTDVIQNYLLNRPIEKSVMVGDGISDWETHTAVDLFVGYGGVVQRSSVKERAQDYLTSFEKLPELIDRRLGEFCSANSAD